MTIADGFPGQHLHVLPRPLVDAALRQSGTSRLLVTDCGLFPHARAHGMTRDTGIEQAVLILCANGRGWCRVRDQEHSVHAGQIIIIPPGVAHAYGADGDDPWSVWWMHVAGHDLAELLAAIRASPDAPVRDVGDLFRVSTLFEEVVQALATGTTRAELLSASGAAWHLLAQLGADRPTGRTRARVIADAREYLESHLAEPVRVADLAAMASMSASHFAARFRAEVGLPVLRFHTEVRMARARALLDMTDRSIASIAAEVGYADPFHFSRRFRAVHGVSAKRYRAHRKG